jgi:hypothetical protein
MMTFKLSLESKNYSDKRLKTIQLLIGYASDKKSKALFFVNTLK